MLLHVTRTYLPCPCDNLKLHFLCLKANPSLWQLCSGRAFLLCKPGTLHITTQNRFQYCSKDICIRHPFMIGGFSLLLESSQTVVSSNPHHMKMIMPQRIVPVIYWLKSPPAPFAYLWSAILMCHPNCRNQFIFRQLLRSQGFRVSSPDYNCS